MQFYSEQPPYADEWQISPFENPSLGQVEPKAEAGDGHGQRDVRMTGLGLLLEKKYVERKSSIDPVSVLMFSLGDQREMLWQIKSMLPGYGAALSQQLRIGDIVTRVDGQEINGNIVSTVVWITNVRS